MGITLRTPIGEITRDTLRQFQSIEDGIINRLDIIGAEFMKQAKDDLKIDRGAFPAVRKGKPGDPPRGAGEYLDDTTNLRNSIGYYVLQNGVVVRGRVEGPAEATSAAMTLLQSIPPVKGYQLVGLAGMDYASYLESKGFNVITSQAMVAMTNVEEQMQRFAKRKNIDIGVDFTGVQTAMR